MGARSCIIGYRAHADGHDCAGLPGPVPSRGEDPAAGALIGHKPDLISGSFSSLANWHVFFGSEKDSRAAVVA